MRKKRKFQCPRCGQELEKDVDFVCYNCGLFFNADESYDEASYTDEEDEGEN